MTCIVETHKRSLIKSSRTKNQIPSNLDDLLTIYFRFQIEFIVFGVHLSYLFQNNSSGLTCHDHNLNMEYTLVYYKTLSTYRPL